MATLVRWGILGTGRIATLFAETLRDMPGADLAAVGSRARERAEKLARRVDAWEAHASYDALVSDPRVGAVRKAVRRKRTGGP
jgi:predicted dehydrogenase